MKSKIFSKLINFTAIVVVILPLCWSCRDDLGYSSSEEIEEGLSAIVKLNVALPDMEIRTREAGTKPAEANQINNLWVALFDSKTGKKTGEITLETPKQIEENSESNPASSLSLEVPTVSGYAYVVGVANAKGKTATIPNGEPFSNDPQNQELWDLLQDIETFDDYKRIVTYMSNPASIGRQGSSSFIMSGVFSNGKLNPQPHTISGDGDQVMIQKGNHQLDGYIHLRRLEAYNLFNVYPGNADITIEPVSWQIINIPALSYLHEKETNAGDDYYNLKEGFYPASNIAYNSSEEFGIQLFDKQPGSWKDKHNGDVTGEYYSFDFYLRENKHTGIITQEDLEKETNPYNIREREYKEENLNTGLYKSLVDETGGMNNNASFVVLNMKVSYWYSGEKDGEDVKSYEPVPEGSEGAIFRTANVTYTIHLGYCEGDDNLSKVNDFNCCRNTKYTYNVYVDGVDNIRIEAMSQEGNEPQSGAEGMVTDFDGANEINLDSHYGVVNIQLTDAERRSLIWRIQAPYGNTVNELTGENSITSTEGLESNQFYNWIQIRPTTGEDIIAPYPGDPRLIGNSKGINTDKIVPYGQEGSIWYLNDLCDPENHPHPDPTNDQNGKWYTIFIDEYVYDPDDETKWGNYVNADDRKLWLINGESYISTDKESIYSKALYMITQESIQSYYSSNRSSEIGIIGLESENESYIFNANYDPWQFTADVVDLQNNRVPDFEINNSDGLLNQWNYITEKNITWDIIYERDNENNLKFRKGLKDKTIDNNGNAGQSDNFKNPDKFHIPNHVNHIMAACMSRNRDLNNNGEIEENEVKWYLPTDEIYTRMMLGASSLRSPLFAAKDYAAEFITAGAGTPYSHYAGSNGRQLWAEELAATGILKLSGNEKSGNLRCIRNIGIDQNHPLQAAYELKEEENAVELTFYRSASLRDYTADHLYAHSVVDNQAYGSRKFQYAKTYCKHNGENRNLAPDYDMQPEEYRLLNNNFKVPNNNFQEKSIGINNKGWTKSINKNSICGYYYEKTDRSDMGSWRVPNITEIGILYFLGVLDADGNDSYASSTYEYFNSRENYYMGVGMTINNITANFGDARVRCVKDIPTNY